MQHQQQMVYYNRKERKKRGLNVYAGRFLTNLFQIFCSTPWSGCYDFYLVQFFLLVYPFISCISCVYDWWMNVCLVCLLARSQQLCSPFNFCYCMREISFKIAQIPFYIGYRTVLRVVVWFTLHKPFTRKVAIHTKGRILCRCRMCASCPTQFHCLPSEGEQ